MDLTELKLALRKCLPNGNVERFTKLLSEYPEQIRIVNSTGIRDIDYLLNEAMIQNDDNSQTHDLCKALFAAGADANSSYYIQSKVGFMQKAAERSLELTELFVKNGAHINHELFGKPACWALISAVCSDKIEIVKYLVEQGAVINFVNIWGMSPLDYANPNREGIRKLPNRDNIYQYLLSLGAKSGLDLPRDHLPPQEEDSIPTYGSIKDYIAEYYSAVEEYPLIELCPESFPISLLKIPGWPGGMIGIITDGLSSLSINYQNLAKDAIQNFELLMIMSPDDFQQDTGKPSESSLWKFDWLFQCAKWPLQQRESYKAINIISNGEPPEPLGPDVMMTCWLIYESPYEDCNFWLRPDGSKVHIMLMTPIHTSERDYERQFGAEAFMNRWKEDGCKYYYKNRPSIVG